MSRRHVVATLLSCAALTAWSGGASAQVGTPQQRLATATSLNCTFVSMAAARWADGTPSAETKPARLTVIFHDINVDEGTADADITFGSAFIAVRYSNGYLHLMQAQNAGPLYTTTVIAKETTGGRLMAVHTRHEYTPVSIPGYTSTPEMYVGDCALGS